MSLIELDVLSIWEIAHRWHQVDPNLTDEKALPLPVQDTLRYLTKLMARHDLRSSSPQGTEYWIAADIDNFSTFVHQHFDEEYLKDRDLDSGEFWEAYERYQDHCNFKIQQHSEIVEDFDKCFKERIFDKKLLDSVYTTRHAIREAIDEQNRLNPNPIPLPEFWFPPGSKEEGLTSEIDQKPKKLRSDQADKLLVQAIAGALWAENPDFTITALTKHKGIRQLGNGAQYEPKTLHNWIAEVDPRDPQQKKGRPKKKSNPK